MAGRKKTQTYEQYKAAERGRRKRTADLAIRAPSMPQITTAFGMAARQVIARERAAERLLDEKGNPIPGPLSDIFSLALDRLRTSGFDVSSGVTVLRVVKATK